MHFTADDPRRCNQPTVIGFDLSQAREPHGSGHLTGGCRSWRIAPSLVDVDSYNVELEDDEGFIGDRASKGAFRQIVENLRAPLRKLGADPLGEEASEDLGKRKLDDLLARGDPEAAGVVQVAIENLEELALVIRRLLKLKGWRDTEES